MSKAERTKEFIIQKSAAVFNTKGYQNTSLSDIQEVTKLTKGAIYGNFSDKNELAIASFNHSCAMIIERINEVISNSATSVEALIAYPNFYVKNQETVFNSGGCPMLNAAVEADDGLPYLRKYVRKNMKRFISLLKSTIETGQQNKELNAKADAEEYATFIYSIVEGNILLAKTMNDPKYFQSATDRIRKLVQQELAI